MSKLKINGVLREPDHPCAVIAMFNRTLTDDELRQLHEFLRGFEGDQRTRTLRSLNG